ncbi:MAG: C-type lectin domain-containing protein [Eudoraea sp.]|jgi:hypothetical protein|uniref:C-type lectin domain-containing protein n=1 Tax=Eudoraea sp. TaxID=1979955 RepID=UPI003C70F6C9
MKYNPLLFLLILLALMGSAIQSYGQGIFLDNFNTTSYSNNNGTANFATNWVETNEGTDPSGGRIQINSNQLRFNNLDGRIITRTLDLSLSTSAALTLDYDATNRNNEGLRIQLWNNNTSAFETIATINTSVTGSISHSLTADQMSAASAIRFIGVDNNWSNGEIIFIDNVQFNAVNGPPNEPPVLNATGDQVYCPGTSMPIAETISITDSDDTSTSSVYIQISTGYVNTEDLLTLTGVHPNITPSWDAVQGELSLTGPATYTEFETAILAVEYTSSAPIPTGTRQFSITVGTANYLPSTGHYYEYVSSLGITWTSANTAANSRSYFGLQGYLATLTSQVEADFSGSQASGVGWIGGSDAATEGVWLWVTGPEAGTNFWNGTAGGSTPNFAFWNTGEPNQSGDEDYAHITHPNVNPNGSWNDLTNTGAASGNYQPQGYVVEYGGMPGDPILSLTATTTLNMDTVAPTASNPSPVTVYCTADIPGVDVNVVSDEADNCTSNPVVTHVGDVSDGGSNPEIITRTYRITDDSGNSIDVTQTITVDSIQITAQPSDQNVFVGNNAIFTVSTSNADTYQWQLSTNGGGSFSNISDGSEYLGTSTSSLTVLDPEIVKNGYLYRVLVSNSGATCPQLTSNSSILSVRVATVITNRKITFRVNKN